MATALAGTAGCSAGGSGSRPVPTPSAQAAGFCRALHERLPRTLDGLERDSAGPDSDFAADWGDPAVQLRCGVERPELLTPGSEHYNPTAEAVEVDGVTWLLEKQDDGYRFTTTGRKAFVEVTVPGKYAPETGVLTEFAAPVEKTVPSEL
ncbi:DUF3515 domain-containing protein [Streptomyces pathocidini]|nr:DUF3515 domain-containing protein [Streptomyces pathocidini]